MTGALRYSGLAKAIADILDLTLGAAYKDYVVNQKGSAANPAPVR